ncbi:unnamed protein product [Thlaspi arvense]|uniref:Uncharacterized protein n=1 Tax=Thlaspi arvense TaxID=13288 RepID=A0AAU9S5K2_THLAR|nr:unnamed protein product [Thlaspi arvense]
MVGPAIPDGDEGISLLEFHGNGDRSWQLNFDDFQVSPEHKEKKPPSKLHNCLGCLGNSLLLSTFPFSSSVSSLAW